ncbi:class I SAM-dependent methyltransferase [Streptomyces sp. NPDC049577]|uniref:class I SAM-dependent methyltransferase n=1 Tax=Streptomyces sp. NPDC049577 TaxID=3155153 RepID=UPI00341F3F90
MTARARQVATLRPRYQRDLADGVERFLGPKLSTCPWCASPRLRRRLRTTDRIQGKPGTFTLDECTQCGHVFQNPQLTPEGLEFYYRDLYDGLGEKTAQRLFTSPAHTRLYRSRAKAMRALCTPERWLDVGLGHGHFCATARQLLPTTVFEGLDRSEGVDIAKDRGRITHGYRGSFTDLASRLTGRYDVVSMHHYLEHTIDPRQELIAARTVLRPGGHLLIEVPDPECRAGHRLGQWWSQWVQPQHLHLMPLRTLREGVTAAGFTVVTADRHAAHLPADLSCAALHLLNAALPAPDTPWAPRRPRTTARWTRAFLFAAASPALVILYALDLAVAPLARRTGWSNAYRLIARRD